MTPQPPDAAGLPRAWGWVAHLRAGGTTPWTSWTGTGEVRGRLLPGAQQLELLRRINRWGVPGPVLADRVLRASVPGRGVRDLQLVGVADSAFGPRPVDPSALPAGELIRVATDVIAEDLVAAGTPPVPRTPRPRPWPRRHHYELGGDPELADPVRAGLIARGRPPGGRGCDVVLLAAPVDRMLAHAWTYRAFTTGAPSWPAWTRQLAQGDRLPGRVDLLQQARDWARIAGRSRIHVVLDPAELPAVLGVRRPPPLPADPPAAVPDLGRRVAAVLGLHVPRQERSALLRRRLRPTLAGSTGPSLLVPAAQSAWVQAQARALTDGLIRAGYAVHGDPSSLFPGARAGVTAPEDDATLELAARLLLSGALGATTNEEEA